jgi:hypothetical protein
MTDKIDAFISEIRTRPTFAARALAAQTVQAGKDAATGDFIFSLIKGVTAVASIGLAPVTGGASLAVGAAAAAAMSGTGGLY